MAEVALRPAEPADVPAILDLFEAVAAEGRWIGTEAPIDRQERGAQHHQSIADPQKLSLLAEADGSIVGHLYLGLNNGLGELGMLVADGWRGRGVGRALLDAAIDWARQSGAHKITLQHWPHNQAARRLYERLGFVEEGYLRRHYRRKNGEIWDAVIMGLVLPEA